MLTSIFIAFIAMLPPVFCSTSMKTRSLSNTAENINNACLKMRTIEDLVIHEFEAILHTSHHLKVFSNELPYLQFRC